jgi:hypothetical protein
MYLEGNIEEEISLISFFNFSAKGWKDSRKGKISEATRKKYLAFRQL